MKTFDISEARCPSCRHAVNSASNMHGKRPLPGDITVCVRCAAVSQFDVKMRLNPVTQKQLDQLPPEHRKELWRMRKGILDIDREDLRFVWATLIGWRDFDSHF